MRSPLRWYGGKHYLCKKIVELIPPHEVYVEPFFGGGSVLFAKEPSPVEVVNDLNGAVVNFFRVVREERLREELIEKLHWTPYSREEYAECLKPLPKNAGRVERARQFFFVSRASFSGSVAGKATPGRFSTSVVSRNGMAHRVSSFQSAIDLLEPVGQRLRTAVIENLDAFDCMKRYDSDKTLFYLDPPYLPETREPGSRNDYDEFEMSLDQHRELSELLHTVEGIVLLSGYDSEHYRDWYSGWQCHTWDVSCSASGQGAMRSKGSSKPRRQEVLWISPNACPASAPKQASLFAT